MDPIVLLLKYYDCIILGYIRYYIIYSVLTFIILFIENSKIDINITLMVLPGARNVLCTSNKSTVALVCIRMPGVYTHSRTALFYIIYIYMRALFLLFVMTSFLLLFFMRLPCFYSEWPHFTSLLPNGYPLNLLIQLTDYSKYKTKGIF